MSGVARLYRRFRGNRAFWRQVQAAAPLDCWPWSGAIDDEGNPQYRGSRADIHAYELARGSFPAGAELEHKCGNRLCLNPRHLAVR